MSGSPDPRVPLLPRPPQPVEERRTGARGVAAVAVIVLGCGATLLGLESCAQTTANKPIQVDPQQKPEREPVPEPDVDIPVT